jgi:hypothetical protein
MEIVIFFLAFLNMLFPTDFLNNKKQCYYPILQVFICEKKNSRFIQMHIYYMYLYKSFFKIVHNKTNLL